MAKKVEKNEYFDNDHSRKISSTGDPITVVTNKGKKVTYILNRKTTISEVKPVEEEEKEEKEPKEKIVNIMEDEDDGFEHINANLNDGLDDEQVILRIQEGFTNEVEDANSKSVIQICLGKIFTVFNLICFAIAAIIIALAIKNGTNPLGDLIFLFIMLGNVLIGIVTEVKSKKLIDQLSFDTNSTVTVVRNGNEILIPSEEIVTDDIMLIKAGQKIPADAKVRSGKIEVNESLITGESVSISKGNGATVFGGSYVVSGTAKLQITNVGKRSYIQKLAKQAKEVKIVQSEIMKSLNSYIKIVGIIIVPLLVLLFGQLTNWFNDLEFLNSQSDVLGALAAIIGMVPTGLILLTSISLTSSVVKLGKQNVLVHELYCIENLARVDTLCLDKTGTITDGTMSVINQIMLTDEDINIKQVISNMLHITKDSNETSLALEAKYGRARRCKAIADLPFSSQRKYSAVSFSEEETYIIGAPEFISKDLYKEHFKQINIEARKGNRVLLLAKSDEVIKNNKVGGNIKAIALIVIQDNIREGAHKTLSFFRRNEVKILVISGDNPLTVSAIARKAGVQGAQKYINMSEVKDKDIPKIVDKYVVFGRVTPSQKQLLVKALKEKGHTVAMTGDGVNDILALKEADCSIAMASGSEAARNVSQIVLTDSNFSSMPSVVAEGRKVINNVQKVATLFVTKNVFSFFIVCFVIATNFFMFEKVNSFPLLPRQLSLIDTLTIGIPATLLAFLPNNKPIQGRFMFNVLKNALPGALAVLFNAVIIYFAAFYASDYISITNIPTMITIATAVTCLLVLLRVFLPINGFKILLFVAIGVILSVLIFGDLSRAAQGLEVSFGFTKLSFPEVLLLIVLAEATYPVIQVCSLSFVKTVRKFFQENKGLWKINQDEDDDFIEEEEEIPELL